MITDKLEVFRLENMKQYGFGVDSMKQIKVCTRCGYTSSTNQQFCTECGYRLPDKSLYEIYKERHKICPQCETIVTDEADYCPQCGEKIENNKLKTR